jgi:hypothetical protein
MIWDTKKKITCAHIKDPPTLQFMSKMHVATLLNFDLIFLILPHRIKQFWLDLTKVNCPYVNISQKKKICELRFSMINNVGTTHCYSFLRLQIKREDIIDKCRECDKNRSIHNFRDVCIVSNRLRASFIINLKSTLS